MTLNTCEMWFNGIKVAVFFQKITKNRPAAAKVSGGWTPLPQTPVCDTFELH